MRLLRLAMVATTFTERHEMNRLLKSLGLGLAALVAIAATTLAVATPAQASAVGCDPLPRPPVRALCAEVRGNGTWVEWADFSSAFSKFTCNAQGAIRFYDNGGANYHNEWGPYGCHWGVGFKHHFNTHMRTGRICMVAYINGSQHAGVCHRIK